MHMMIRIGTGAVNFSTEGVFFVATSFTSSDSQKKVNSDSEFRCGDVGVAVTFFGEVTSFVSSTSGFQKKERSVMGFVCGVTGKEMSFVVGVIRSETTC